MSICAICGKVSNDPVCCVPCGHIFCKDCIKEWIKKDSYCAECRKIITDRIAIYIRTAEPKDIVAENTELKAKLKACKDENKKLEKLLTKGKSRLSEKLEDQKEKISKYKDKIEDLKEDNKFNVKEIKALKEQIKSIAEKARTFSTEQSILCTKRIIVIIFTIFILIFALQVCDIFH